MEHYLATVQNAYATLDVSHLSDVMTDNVIQYWVYMISPEAGVYHNSSVTILDFKVNEYSANHAVVTATVLDSNNRHVDSKTGQTETFSDSRETGFYTLSKINGVWKVSGDEPPH